MTSWSICGVTPNHREKPGTAWCSSMPRPPTVRRPPCCGGGKQGRGERHVDDVRDGERGGRAGEIEVQFWRAVHAGGCGVDQQRVVRQGGISPGPIQDFDAWQCGGQGGCALRGAVGDADADAEGEQFGGDGAGGATGAEQKGGAGHRVYAVGAQIGEETGAVGVAAGYAFGRERKRIHGAGAARGIIDARADRERGFLVRDRYVGAAEAGGAQAEHGGREVFRRHGQRHVGAVDGVAGEPEIMQFRRAGVGDRPPEGRPPAVRRR